MGTVAFNKVELPEDMEEMYRWSLSQRMATSGLLPDWIIRQYVGIDPLAPMENRPGKISYGLTSYGYDARIGYKFRIFDPLGCEVVDPKNPTPHTYRDFDLTPYHGPFQDGPDKASVVCTKCNQSRPYQTEWWESHCPKAAQPDHVLIPPNSYALGETVEFFEIPRDVLALCVGKSTYARCGLIANVTPLEPEWQGKVTVEISNSSPLPAKVYCGEGIMQVLFFRALAPCRTSYADKKGIYQNQTGLTNARVRA